MCIADDVFGTEFFLLQTPPVCRRYMRCCNVSQMCFYFNISEQFCNCSVCITVGRPGSYDVNHRNPLYCHADAECTWELLCLTRHYHPSVALFADTLLKARDRKFN